MPTLADRSHLSAAPGAAVTLGAVLDHQNAVTTRYVDQRIQIGKRTVQVDDDDRAGARSDRGLDGARTQAERLLGDVDQNRTRVDGERRDRGSDPGETGHDDFIARRQIQRGKRRDERACAVGRRNAETDVHPAREGFREFPVPLTSARRPRRISTIARYRAPLEAATRRFRTEEATTANLARPWRCPPGVRQPCVSAPYGSTAI